jgi:uncharacterized protein YcbK (DUF882 family)
LSIKDEEFPSPEVIENLTLLANRLQVIRDLLQKPIIINSGFRSTAYNRKVGGAERSQHILGKAADIRISEMTPREVQNFFKDWSGGLGSYHSFTHVDIRDTKVRWSA